MSQSRAIERPAGTEPSQQSRQKPGAACEECRRRKLRCDRQQPRCGLCQASGVACQVNESRPTRGPKRGYLRTLQARIATLEQSLHRQSSENTMNALTNNHGMSNQNFSFLDQNDLPWDFPICEEVTAIQELGVDEKKRHSSVQSLWDETSTAASTSADGFENDTHDLAVQDAVRGMDTFEVSDYVDKSSLINDLMQADLDQLYFDRMHNFAPFIHQRRYYAWRRLPVKTEAQKCLQYAMWTLASSVSAHYKDIGEHLYQQTLSALQDLDSKSTSGDIDQVQAWLLLAIHEFFRVDFHRGWMNSGHAFRFIQLHWLHGFDKDFDEKNWIETERKCRTFWTAYCLDRFVSMRTRSPLTFTEQILIRLPMPESNFQNEQPIQMGFLPEVLNTGAYVMSTFIEYIAVATICGRALSHRLESSLNEIHLNNVQDLWTRYQWLSNTLLLRIESFSLRYPLTVQQDDPMLLFIGMMWQTTVLDLCNTMESAILPTASESKGSVVAECMTHSLNAAQEMVKLASKLSQLNCLKVHPLMPIPVSLCTESLIIYPDLQSSFTKQLQRMTEVMPGFQHLRGFAGTFRNP